MSSNGLGALASAAQSAAHNGDSERKRNRPKKYITLTDREREQIVRLRLTNVSASQISSSLSTVDRVIPVKTIHTVVNVWKKEHRFKMKKKGGSLKRYTDEHRQAVEEIQESDNELTYAQIRERWRSQFPDAAKFKLSDGTIARCLRTPVDQSEPAFSTKNLEHAPIERNTAPAIERRKQYCLRASSWDDSTLIFIDEFGVNLHLNRRRGRSRIGVPAIVRQANAKGGNISVIAGISPRFGLILYAVELETVDSDRFMSFFNQLLNTDELKRCTHTIVMDNCRIHSRERLKELLSGQELVHNLEFLPPYSPQLNPIEECFAKWKHYIKIHDKRNRADLLELIEEAADSINDEDCQGWYRHW